MARGSGDIVYEIGGTADSLIAAATSGSKSLRAMERDAKALQTQIDRMGKVQADYQRALNQTIGVQDRVAKSAKASAQVFREWESASKQVNALRASIDPLYAASQRYEQALETLDAAVQKGIISQAEHTRMVDLAGKAFLTAGVQADQSASQIGGFAGVMARNRAAVQMFGYNIQDVAVQLAAGTRATTVFAQQGSQMLGALGPYGALAGAALAVTLPLAGAFFSAGEGAKDAKKAISELGSSFDAYTAFIKTATTSTAELRKEFGDWAGDVKGFAEFAAANQLASTMDELGTALDPIRSKLTDIQGQWQHIAEYQQYINELVAQDAPSEMIQNARDILAMFQDNLVQAADTLGVTVDQARALAAAMEDLDRARASKSIAETADAAGRVLALIDSMADASGAVDAGLRPVRDTMQQIYDKAAAAAAATNTLASETETATKAVQILAGTQPGPGWLSVAIRQAQVLTGVLWNANDAANSLSFGGEGGVNLGTGAQTGVGYSMSDGSTAYAPYQSKKKSGGGKGGGGGGGKDPLAADLEQLQQQLLSKAEIELAAYEEQQAMLEQALDKKLLTQQEYAALMEAAQREHQQKMVDIDVWRYGDGLEKAGAFMDLMADVMQNGNEKMLKMAKVFGAAEALISTWVAYAKALKDGGVTPWERMAWAMKILAAGMGAVKAIQGAGGGSGSSGGKGSTSAPAAAAAPNPATVNIAWNGAMTADSMGSLTQKLNAEYKQGYRLNFVAA